MATIHDLTAAGLTARQADHWTRRGWLRATCKVCPLGVYKGQAKTWGTGIGVPIGWSHTGCVELAGGVTRA
jgi:hypothetical protein